MSSGASYTYAGKKYHTLREAMLRAWDVGDTSGYIVSSAGQKYAVGGDIWKR